ncbi:Vesicle-trafficking protein SEC22b-B [Armadillidium nasatum]|uniref:Vesicle-trafficking protein SEC22b-B n=1 Tax=Armadillidium nasatum TaxID=96803 RepID=A0A5N5SRX6_9CRUS|nr:Vesicle-trafficking protein SEC22b-B [Armadillidium nasatum]
MYIFFLIAHSQEEDCLEYQNQAKMLFKKLTPNSPEKCTIETGPYLFQCITLLTLYFTDTFIQKLRRQYSGAPGRRNIHQLRDDLNDVQRIMMENIDDVLQRGTALSDLETKASGLSVISEKYRKDAQYLNLRSTYAKIAAGGVLVLVFVLYFFVL